MKRRDFLKKTGSTLLAVPGARLLNNIPFEAEVKGSDKAAGEKSDFEASFMLHQVRLKKSPFKDAMDLNGKYLLALDVDRLLACFYETEGMEPKAPKYGAWENGQLQGHTLGHYLSACSMMTTVSNDANYQKRVDYIVDVLNKLQTHGRDGYIGGIPNGRKLWRKVASGRIKTEPFSLNGLWSPWYNLHKTYAGLRDAYKLARNEKAKKVLVKYSDWAIQITGNLSEQQFQKMLECEYGGMNEVMADVYGITGDKKYLSLARRFNHKAVFDPLAAGKDELDGLHANTQIPKIIGAAREYELDSDDRMEKVASYFWTQVAQKRAYIYGGNSFKEHFGKLGELPNRLGKATTETCNTYNMLKLTEHLMNWTHDSKHADFYERALYNHILASIDAKTGQVTYFVSSDPGFYKTYSTPFHSFWCCRGTGMENHTKYGKAIYMRENDDLYVNLFIPSVLNDERRGLKIDQSTRFPDSDQTKLEVSVDHPQEFNIHIRQPYWANDEFDVAVNGKSVSANNTTNGYLPIKRKWKSGDVITISAPKKLHVEPMQNDKEKVAIMYGPFVLAAALGKKWMHAPEPYATDESEYFDTPSVKVPLLKIPEGSKITDFIKTLDKGQLHFTMNIPSMDQELTLKPFYQINIQRYTVYWQQA